MDDFSRPRSDQFSSYAIGPIVPGQRDAPPPPTMPAGPALRHTARIMLGAIEAGIGIGMIPGYLLATLGGGWMPVAAGFIAVAIAWLGIRNIRTGTQRAGDLQRAAVAKYHQRHPHGQSGRDHV